MLGNAKTAREAMRLVGKLHEKKPAARDRQRIYSALFRAGAKNILPTLPPGMAIRIANHLHALTRVYAETENKDGLMDLAGFFAKNHGQLSSGQARTRAESILFQVHQYAKRTGHEALARFAGQQAQRYQR